MALKNNDIVRLRTAHEAVGTVVGSTQGGRVMVQWATTASGKPLTHGLLLVEDPEDLEMMGRLEWGGEQP